MGRSVSHLSRAKNVTYINYETSFQDEETGEWLNDEFAFDDLFGNIKYGLMAKYPSLQECERWGGREDRIFLQNNLVEIAISEYCGLVAISVRPNEYYGANEALAENWIDRVWLGAEKKLSEFSTVIRKVATASNGEAFFELKTFA